MTSETQKQILKDALPFNRSEQYFTATIFPMLVAGDGFRRFHRFVELLDEFDVPAVRSDGANAQFLTEFSLRKALVGRAKKRFPNAPDDGDTPDIVTLVEGEGRRVLIVLEGKMYSVSRRADLRRQMKRQRKLIDFLAQKIGVRDADIYHAALLAGAHRDEMGDFDYPILTWEDLVAAYRPVLSENYFLRQLEEALARFDELRGTSSADSYGKNREEYLTGAEIVRRYEAGTLEYPVMGRNYGFNGRLLAQDVETGNWRTQNYEVNSSEEPPNRNWFRVERFVDLVVPK